MIKIRYQNEDLFREVEFHRVSPNVVQLTSARAVANRSGFFTYRASDEMPLGDFTDYGTVYDHGADFVMYSNDGSVKPEPQPEPVPPEPDPDVPTWQDVMEAQVMYTALMTDTLLEE